MPHPPAICEKCGAIFAAPIELGNSHHISFSNFGTECPYCKSVAFIPNGVYSVINSTVVAYRRGEVSEEHLRRLSEIVEDARKRDAEPEEVAKTIRSEVPELGKVADDMPKKGGIKGTLAYISLFISVLNFVLGRTGSSPVSEERLQQIIDESTQKVCERLAPTAKAVDKSDPILQPLLDAYQHCPRGRDKHMAGKEFARAMLDAGVLEYQGYQAERVYAGTVSGKDAEAKAWLKKEGRSALRANLEEDARLGCSLPGDFFVVKVKLIPPTRRR